MTNNIEFLIELMGTTKAEEVLKAHLRKNFDADGDGQQKLKKSKKLMFGAKRWKSEEDSRIRSVIAEIGFKTAVIRDLARELGRTPNAVYQRAYKLKLITHHNI